MIESRYNLRETSTKSYPQRTERNVQDSDGTVIFTIAPKLTGGSKKTADLATKHRKPWLHFYPTKYSDCAEQLVGFVCEHGVKTLNVAGSRASKEPKVCEFVKATLENAFLQKPAY